MKPRWKRIYEGAYSLKDSGPAGNVSMFLLVGSEKALLVDSGYGLLDLPDLIHEVTDKPVTLVNTHGHLDHANGSWQFENAYLRSEDMELYRYHAAPDFLRESFAGKTGETQLAAMMAASPAKLLVLDDINSFDLGDRSITVIHMPGHTRGHVCLLDEVNHAAFTGDNLCCSIWLSLPESLTVAEYKNVLEKILITLQSKEIIWNYAAHNPRKARIQDDIRRFLICCDAILTGSKKPHFLDAGVTSGNYVGKAGRYILYPKD